MWASHSFEFITFMWPTYKDWTLFYDSSTGFMILRFHLRHFHVWDFRIRKFPIDFSEIFPWTGFEMKNWFLARFHQINDMSMKWECFLKRSIILNMIDIEFNNNEIFYCDALCCGCSSCSQTIQLNFCIIQLNVKYTPSNNAFSLWFFNKSASNHIGFFLYSSMWN